MLLFTKSRIILPKNHMNIGKYFLASLLFFSCNSQEVLEPITTVNETDSVALPVIEEKYDLLENAPGNREEIVRRLKSKVEQKEPLVVHCFVPLCDNEHQGIVPTSPSLGNGFSLTSNLYWATSHGMKKYFQKHKEWREIEVLNYNPSDTLLERVAFERIFENDAKVILICDAYRGDMMEPCLNDYLGSLGGQKNDSINYEGEYVGISQSADLLAFNGHNGLMDVWADTVYAQEERLTDAVVIACASKSYFNPYFVQTNSYPLVNTTSLLWPGAMILNAVIEKWAVFSDDEEIAHAAGDAYHEVKSCGQQAARNMFATGW